MIKYGIYFAEPFWLIGCLLVIPVAWLGVRNLSTLGPVRRYTAIILRCLTILILVALLARMMFTRTNEHITVIAVRDKSLSISENLQDAAHDYLTRVISEKEQTDLFAVVDIAESAGISSLPSAGKEIQERNTTLTGTQSRLSEGVQMAMAIAPPDTAARILMISDGNQTSGDLKEAARLAAASGIPIDVLPLQYEYKNEIVFKKLAVPASVRSGQTVSMRFILSSTTETTGKLVLNLNGEPVDLSPGFDDVAVPIQLKPGTNVKNVSIPVGSSGVHNFRAYFVPDEPQTDRVAKNNYASAMTFVAGPGHIKVFDVDGQTAETLVANLKSSNIDSRHDGVENFPDNLTHLMNTDAVILVNTDISNFTFQQQEILCKYVNDLGGGLIMIGGDKSFGAGGWIGSPLAEILPVDLDPSQKKQLPKGALVLVIDHSGSMTGLKLQMAKSAAAASVRLLSRRDQVGVVVFDSLADWLVPMTDASDKEAIYDRIGQLGGGGGTNMYPGMEYAAEALRDADTDIKHVILLTDGQTAGPDCRAIAATMASQGITISTVALGEGADFQLLQTIAEIAGGRSYPVPNPQQLPQIFVKEAQIVRRVLINEETFTPQLTYSLNEITRGLSFPLPQLDGYVLTGPKEGLSQVILSSHTGDPILATGQSGLGRCVAFTSSVDSKWAGNWIAWPGFGRFWEQAVRWAAKSSQSTDCEVFVDVQGRDVSVNIEAVDAEGDSVQLANIDAQILSPDVSSKPMDLSQIGPGNWQGSFQAFSSGSYIVNLRYRKIGEDTKTYTKQVPVSVPFAPEFRDLTDNAKLLEEISKISGGRVLDENPAEVNLFIKEGLKFPRTQLPLTKPLMLIWLGIFLLDIAVRRISVDLAAIKRKTALLIARRRTASKADENLQRLQRIRKQASDRLTERAIKQKAARRYDGSQKPESQTDIPVAKENQIPEPAPRKTEKPKKTEDKDQPPQSHIDQLLKIKKNKDGSAAKDE